MMGRKFNQFLCDWLGHDEAWEYLPYGPVKICGRCLKTLDNSIYLKGIHGKGRFDYSDVGKVSIFYNYKNPPPKEKWLPIHTNRCSYCGAKGNRVETIHGDYCSRCTAPWLEEIRTEA